jgi:hypothetical protein
MFTRRQAIFYQKVFFYRVKNAPAKDRSEARGRLRSASISFFVRLGDEPGFGIVRIVEGFDTEPDSFRDSESLLQT